MWSEEVKKVATDIGRYYLQKAFDGIETTYDILPPHNSAYAKAEAEINRLGISNIEVIGNNVRITAAHLGLLIGVRGRNIDALEKYLNMQVKLVEDIDPLSSYLIPRNYEEHY